MKLEVTKWLYDNGPMFLVHGEIDKHNRKIFGDPMLVKEGKLKPFIDVNINLLITDIEIK